jgi:23S rRNA-/tRNA-specific pseudouridylate synthase
MVAPSSAPRLDLFIASALDLSRTQAATLIATGQVRVDGRSERASYRPTAGEHVVVEIPPRAARAVEAESIPLTVVFEDDEVLVVDKPAGMVVHPAAGHAHGTRVNALLHQVNDLSGIGGELRPGIVHRLDRGTSGLMVVAKNDKAHVELARQFHDREVEKEYVALVWGLGLWRQAGRPARSLDRRDGGPSRRPGRRSVHVQPRVCRTGAGEPFAPRGRARRGRRAQLGQRQRGNRRSGAGRRAPDGRAHRIRARLCDD